MGRYTGGTIFRSPPLGSVTGPKGLFNLGHISRKNLVIFDGSNFYHRAKEVSPQVHLTSFQYRRFTEILTASADAHIVYCVGEVKEAGRGNTKAKELYAGQQALFGKLKSQGVAVKTGFRLERGGVYHEKGVDVQIATDMVCGALRNEYDTCYVISSDSDLVPAIAAAREAGKEVVYVAFRGTATSKALLYSSSRTVFITKEFLEQCA